MLSIGTYLLLACATDFYPGWVGIIFVLGIKETLGSPATTITPNGLTTSVTPASAGYYNIQGGTVFGSNLFHSFSAFNLGTGDTADFNVTNGISNIVARVTGGPSTIDGKITSTNITGGTLSNANLFFINPAGVLFTANAQVSLGGSFAISTADYVKLNEGSIFYADATHPIKDAGLTSAPVSAFGFLSTAPQPVTFTGSQIITGTGRGLHVLGGDITLDSATLLAPGGQLTLFSADSAGEVSFQLTAPGAGQAHATTPAFGTITLRNGSLAAIDGHGGGAVSIRGGRIVADHSLITSFNSGAIAGGNISVMANQVSLTDGAAIATDAHPGATATGGSIAITTTGDVQVSGTGPNGIGSEISADTETGANTGAINLQVGGTLQLQDSGSILANSDGAGQAGTVNIHAATANLGVGTSISVGANGSGNGGTVNVDVAGALNMTGNSSITADSLGGNGEAGNVSVRALQLNMSGTSEISANADYGEMGVTAGHVDVETGSLTIQGQGTLIPTFFGLVGETGILAESFEFANAGDGGAITVKTGALSMNGGAVISASSLGVGNGGDVSVTCTTGQLSNQSEISSTSYTDAGAITVVATQSLKLSGDSRIDTSAGNNGGNLTLRVGQLLYLNNSQVLAYAGVAFLPGLQVGGNGGNILIDPQFVILHNSLISANDLALTGADGNIQNDTAYFFTSGSTLYATGTIDTTDPDLDLGREILGLPTDLVHAENRLREQCARSLNHEFSSFIVVGRGGTETAPEEFQPDFGL